jgi:predicted  nucleic acid-binding Zn-ribbon protein
MSAAGASTQEMKKMELLVKQKEREIKQLKQEIQDMNSNKRTSASDMSDLQKERDDLVLKNEQLTELLSKNNLTVPSGTT